MACKNCAHWFSVGVWLVLSTLVFINDSLASEANAGDAVPSKIVASKKVLRIHGSNTVGAALVPELSRQWLNAYNYKVVSDNVTAHDERLIKARDELNDEISIEIFAHGSSTAFADLKAGTADIGMASRPIKESELYMLRSLGELNKPNTEYIIAIDGLAVIVNPANPLKQISKDTLQKIFSGQINNWSKLGLPAGEIHVYARDDNSGTYDTFKHLVLSEKTPLTKTARRYESNADLSDDVAKDPNGIGFCGLAYIRKSHALAVAETGATALLPAKFNVATEDYALSRRLYLYLPGKNTHPLATSFAEYAQSDDGQRIAEKVGFVSQEVIAYDKKAIQQAPKEYRQLVENAQRLSLNIRFREGKAYMDNKAMHDVERLIHFMKKPDNQHKKLMLFGFSDSHEASTYYSLSLSIDRVDAVADQLLHYKLEADRVRGYGEEVPVSSNDTEPGRIRNRRVEVWIH